MDPHRGDLPDMSLPDASIPGKTPNPEPASPTPTPPPPRPKPTVFVGDEILTGAPAGRSPEGWRVGDRVFAPWEPMYLYGGVIEGFSGNTAFIRFDDGDAGPALIESLKPLKIHVGQRVESRIKMANNFAPATVRWADGDDVIVDFDRGGEEHTTIAALRIPIGADIFSGGLAPSSVRSPAPAPENSSGRGTTWIIWIVISVGLAMVRACGRSQHMGR